MARTSPTSPPNSPPTNFSHEHPENRETRSAPRTRHRSAPAAHDPTSPSPIRFTPEDIYYESSNSKYLVDAGGYYRTIGKRSPVLHGLIRHFADQGAGSKEARELATATLSDAELDRHVEWTGNLAGHRKGLARTAEGKPLLILSSPPFAKPQHGPMDLLSGLIRSAFPDRIPREIFLGWLAHAYRAVSLGIHQPQPMLVLAGEPGAGKSLLAFIAAELLGGRVADPPSASSPRSSKSASSEPPISGRTSPPNSPPSK